MSPAPLARWFNEAGTGRGVSFLNQMLTVHTLKIVVQMIILLVVILTPDILFSTNLSVSQDIRAGEYVDVLGIGYVNRFVFSRPCIMHPLTPIMVISNPLSPSSTCYDPWHPLGSIYVPDSLFAQSRSTFFWSTSWPAPSTLYSVHFFTQSWSSFRNTCPYHRNLFCCNTEIM